MGQLQAGGRALQSVDEIPEGQVVLQDACEATQVAERQSVGKVCSKACVQVRTRSPGTVLQAATHADCPTAAQQRTAESLGASRARPAHLQQQHFRQYPLCDASAAHVPRLNPKLNNSHPTAPPLRSVLRFGCRMFASAHH